MLLKDETRTLGFPLGGGSAGCWKLEGCDRLPIRGVLPPSSPYAATIFTGMPASSGEKTSSILWKRNE